MSSDFYRALEDTLRGPRELVKSRLRVYLPFVRLLTSLYSEQDIVDLGCGRGEWLELLKDIGVTAHGIDLDDHMLAACRERDLPVETGDAISHLRTLPSESHVIVSGFHLAEHLAFADLQILVQEALRVLKPAGLLILETPNPENIMVGTANFYLDPTHHRPIPPGLLAFLPEHYGFCRTKVLRLQESPDLAASTSPSLLSVLTGVSPDYAIVAQKRAPDEQLARFRSVFEKEYGLTLETLAARYDMKTESAARQAQAILNLPGETAAREPQLRTQLTQAQRELADLRAATDHAAPEAARRRLHDVGDPNRRHRQLVETLQRHIPRVLKSASRRVTARLRSMRGAVPDLTPRTLEHRAKVLLRHAAPYVRRRPRLRTFALGILTRFPAVKSRLDSAIGGARIPSARPPYVTYEMAQLTPRARRICADLTDAIARREKGTG